MSNTIETIDLATLDNVTGGNALTSGLKVGAKVAGKWGAKAIPFVNAASTAYDVYQGGKAAYNSYKAGNGVGGAAWDGVKAGAKSFVGMD